MKLVKIKFKELELTKTDFLHNNIYLTVHYEEDKQIRQIERIFNIDDNIPNFSKKIINDIKNECKRRYADQSLDEYEFLSGIVTVVLDEHEDGFTELRLIDGVRRIKDKIFFFKKVRSASNYMSSYHDLNETKIRL